jgi:hypothetical protein
MPKGPLHLTDDQLAAVLRAAEPLAVGDRGAFSYDKGSPRGDNDINLALDELGRDLGGALSATFRA